MLKPDRGLLHVWIPCDTVKLTSATKDEQPLESAYGASGKDGATEGKRGPKIFENDVIYFINLCLHSFGPLNFILFFFSYKTPPKDIFSLRDCQAALLVRSETGYLN